MQKKIKTKNKKQTVKAKTGKNKKVSLKASAGKNAAKASKKTSNQKTKRQLAKDLPLEKRFEGNKAVQNEVKKLLSAKTPEKYIDISVKSKLPSSIKGLVTRHWISKSKYSIDDIKFSRNRHPYWKDKKQTNHTERTRKRFEQYNFSNGVSRKWTKEELTEFIKINEKYTDRELAEHFTRSIPSIQGIRRRINLGSRILTAKGEKGIKKSALNKFVRVDEKVLRRELAQIKK